MEGETLRTAIITGGNKGLGLWISEYLEGNGYKVLNFSRTLGCDLNKRENRLKLLNCLSGSELFVNNAHDGFLQCELLQEVFSEWRLQPKRIINIGSSSFPMGTWNLVHKNYIAEKAALHIAAERLQQEQDRQCLIHVLKLGILDTADTKPLLGDKISKEVVCRSLQFVLSQPWPIEVKTIEVCGVAH